MKKELQKNNTNEEMKVQYRGESYKKFIGEIKNKIRDSQYEAMRAVNQTLIRLYWGIGEEIYKQQQEKRMGKINCRSISKRNTKRFSKC